MSYRSGTAAGRAGGAAAALGRWVDGRAGATAALAVRGAGYPVGRRGTRRAGSRGNR